MSSPPPDPDIEAVLQRILKPELVSMQHIEFIPKDEMPLNEWPTFPPAPGDSPCEPVDEDEIEPPWETVGDARARRVYEAQRAEDKRRYMEASGDVPCEETRGKRKGNTDESDNH